MALRVAQGQTHSEARSREREEGDALNQALVDESLEPRPRLGLSQTRRADRLGRVDEEEVEALEAQLAQLPLDLVLNVRQGAEHLARDEELAAREAGAGERCADRALGLISLRALERCVRRATETRRRTRTHLGAVKVAETGCGCRGDGLDDGGRSAVLAQRPRARAPSAPCRMDLGVRTCSRGQRGVVEAGGETHRCRKRGQER